MAPHSSTLAWKISWTEEPGRLQSMRSLRVGYDWAASLSLFTFLHWRRKWQPTPVFLPGESQGRWSLVGCRLWGRTVGHDWSNLAAAATTLISNLSLISITCYFQYKWNNYLNFCELLFFFAPEAADAIFMPWLPSEVQCLTQVGTNNTMNI